MAKQTLGWLKRLEIVNLKVDWPISKCVLKVENVSELALHYFIQEASTVAAAI